MDTIPKFVSLNIQSIIHIILGTTPGRELKLAINMGTSLVDWWLTITSVRSSKHTRMSSPTSTTENNNANQLFYNLTIFISDFLRIKQRVIYCSSWVTSWLSWILKTDNIDSQPFLYFLLFFSYKTLGFRVRLKYAFYTPTSYFSAFKTTVLFQFALLTVTGMKIKSISNYPVISPSFLINETSARKNVHTSHESAKTHHEGFFRTSSFCNQFHDKICSKQTSHCQ